MIENNHVYNDLKEMFGYENIVRDPSYECNLSADFSLKIDETNDNLAYE